MPSRSAASSDQVGEVKGCTIKILDKDKWIPAAEQAIRRNPANAPNLQMLQRSDTGALPDKHRLALLASKYWGNAGVHLTVSFLDGPEAKLRARIVSHMNAWAKFSNVKFVEVESDGEVRIARTARDGFWSYLGTDIYHVAKDEPTMNLDSFTLDTPESEYHRVVRHETGHTLGFVHEHMREGIVARIDHTKAINYFMATQGWTKEEVIAQVLTPYSNSSLMATEVPDGMSVMCYWLPASIMKDGKEVPGGTDIDTQDGAFAALIYPKKVRSL